MIVELTPESIAQAEKNRLHKAARNWSEHDHIACAIKRQIPKAHVAVGLALVTVKYPDGDVHYYTLPPEGMEIVRKADFREEIVPTTFALIPAK